MARTMWSAKRSSGRCPWIFSPCLAAKPNDATCTKGPVGPVPTTIRNFAGGVLARSVCHRSAFASRHPLEPSVSANREPQRPIRTAVRIYVRGQAIHKYRSFVHDNDNVLTLMKPATRWTTIDMLLGRGTLALIISCLTELISSSASVIGLEPSGGPSGSIMPSASSWFCLKWQTETVLPMMNRVTSRVTVRDVDITKVICCTPSLMGRASVILSIGSDSESSATSFAGISSVLGVVDSSAAALRHLSSAALVTSAHAR
jgi:hypothetical protein